ncbi:hypothetical protein MKX01_018117 [Papaver californicum]|nr:hypothetical protein MKX01_018117 [Papaver californicum]
MDPKLIEVAQSFEIFKAASVRNDLDTCNNLLSHLKVTLTGFRSLPPLLEETPNSVHELTIARDIYEHVVVLSVKAEDQDAFERNFFQLKPYYTDTAGRLPPSVQEYPILGLNLLRLLVQNRIAEFHTELEILSAGAMENPCIKHAMELEQSLMEGAYIRVLSARQTVPHETYVYFMDLLPKTVSFKFLDATSDEPWGPHGTQFTKIAKRTKMIGSWWWFPRERVRLTKKLQTRFESIKFEWWSLRNIEYGPTPLGLRSRNNTCL